MIAKVLKATFPLLNLTISSLQSKLLFLLNHLKFLLRSHKLLCVFHRLKFSIYVYNLASVRVEACQRHRHSLPTSLLCLRPAALILC